MEDLDEHWQCFNEKCSQRDRCVPCRANLKNVKQLIVERERNARIDELEAIDKTDSRRTTKRQHLGQNLMIEDRLAELKQLKKEG